VDSSRFFSLIAVTVFLAVGAYVGTSLYDRVDSPVTQAVTYYHYRDTAALQGIVIRQEQSLSLARGYSFAAQDGQRLSAGEILTLDPKGQGVPAELAGTYFDKTDGFEYLSIDSIDALDLSALESLLSAKPKESADGRYVTGSTWYYWAEAEASAKLQSSGSCSVQFEGMSEAVNAQIISLSPASAGKQAILLRLTQGGSQYLSLRKCQATALFSQYSGLYLPLSALHEDEEGNKFVYTLNVVDTQVQPVELIYTGKDFALALSSDSGLQPGDIVVVR
jgi:hypothetical protein